MAEAVKTGAPVRTRKPAATTKAAAKPATRAATATKAPTKAAATPKAEEAPPADLRAKKLIPFEYTGDTKTYSVFQPPKDSGVVGKVYAPHGTEEVRVLLVFAEDAEAE